MIAGVDEAGRGPLAGPVVAAAVVLCGKDIRGLGDSKVLDAATRAKLERRIRERCHVGIGIASVEEIDAIKSQISEAEDREKPKVNFEVGETIKINDGPFLNFSGVIEDIDYERGKLKVTVNIFGRNTPVELEYWQVEKS